MAAGNRPPTGSTIPKTEPENPPTLIRIGRIAGSHGLTGALRLKVDNPGSDILEKVSRVFVMRAGECARECKLLSARRINRTTVRIALGGIDTPEGAEALRGAIIMVAMADMPPLGPGEFYYVQALGCEVVTSDLNRIGIVEEVFSNGANDVWVVRNGKSEVLIPVIEDIVKEIDIPARKITIEPVPGLLDQVL